MYIANGTRVEFEFVYDVNELPENPVTGRIYFICDQGDSQATPPRDATYKIVVGNNGAYAPISNLAEYGFATGMTPGAIQVTLPDGTNHSVSVYGLRQGAFQNSTTACELYAYNGFLRVAPTTPSITYPGPQIGEIFTIRVPDNSYGLFPTASMVYDYDDPASYSTWEVLVSGLDTLHRMRTGDIFQILVYDYNNTTHQYLGQQICASWGRESQLTWNQLQ